LSLEADFAVVVFTPLHADAITLKKIVEDEKLTAICCHSAEEFYKALANAVLFAVVTEEGLACCSLDKVQDILRQQESWSNIPILVLAEHEERNIDSNRFVRLVEMGNVTLLLRPTSRLNLVLAFRSALSTRLLQFAVREHIRKLSAHAEQLELLVSERTRELEAEVTARHRIEQQFAENRRLESLGRLTGGIAHDFNNLLQVIIGHEGLLRIVMKSDVSPAARKSLDSIRRAADHGASLTQQLLAYARRQPLASVVVDLNAHLKITLEMIRRMLGPKIRVYTEISTSLWPLFVDPAQLDSAILNIVANARDAMDSDGVLVVRARNCYLPQPSMPVAGDLAGEFVEISFTDNGHGMADDTLTLAFDPFFTTKPVGKGTGLGLSQVHGFAAQSHGLAFIRQERPGVTVGMLLPRSQDIPVPSDFTGTVAENPLSNVSVLYVEDNPEVAEITTTMLQTLGATVTVIDSADAAVQTDFSAVDVVLSDVMMPGKMDGIDLAQWLSKNYPHIPIVLTSGYVLDPERLSSVNARFVRKPCLLEALAEAIGNALKEKK